MAGFYVIRGLDAGEEGEETPDDAIDAQKALFGDVRPWKYRNGLDIESEYVESLKSSRAKRDGNLFKLLVAIAELPERLANISEKMRSLESQLLDRGGYRLKWQAWLGNPHSAVYLMDLSDESKAAGKSLGNLFTSDEARERLKEILGRNKGGQYAVCLDDYAAIKKKISLEMRLSGADFKFKPDRTKHPVDQWVASVGPFWEALSVVTQHNIDRYLDLDGEANEVAFEFNFERQPIRWRTIVLRPPIKKTDPMGPGFPEFRVVTNIDRTTKKRQTKAITDYKRDLMIRSLERSLTKTLGRAPTKEEVKEARQQIRSRACTMWITEELLAHCKLGKHITKINKHQRKLQALHAEWSEKRDRLRGLME